MASNILEMALEYLKRGWSVIPLCPPGCSKETVAWHWKGGKCGGPGKNPLVIWKEFQEKPPTEEQVNEWWDKFPWANIGIVTGEVSDLVVMDFDSNEAIEAIKDFGDIPSCLQVRTGGDGVHAYFKHPSDGSVVLKNFVGKLEGVDPGLAKIDLRCTGGQVVAPPSIHQSGNQYKWLTDYDTFMNVNGNLPELPMWFLDLMEEAETSSVFPARRARRAASCEPSREPIAGKTIIKVGSWPKQQPKKTGGDWVITLLSGVVEGKRNDACARLAGHFLAKGLSVEEVEAILFDWNAKNQPPMGESDVSKVIWSIARAEVKQTTRKYFRKKKGFIPKFLADDIMSETNFIYAGEILFRYTGGVYRQDGEHFVEAECQRLLGLDSRRSRINEVIYYIQVAVRKESEALNKNEGLINLHNGMFDWVKGELLSHNPDYLSTIRIPVTYNSSEVCPTIDYFFESTLPDDCVPVAEELFGYCLIPYVHFEKAFMLTGAGANGKSTFLTLLEAFAGSDNVSKIPLQELDENRFKRAELFGKLVNLFADLDTRALKGSSYFKTVVSGDMIDAERKHRDPFFFRPFARLAYSANQLPTSYDKTFAYYRRWVIIPFPHRFVGKNADKSLGDKLIQPDELSGLLNRALAGLNRLFENQDFTQSQTTQDALEDYKKQNDTVVAFVGDCCEFGPSAKIERTVLYDAYTKYCEAEGFEAVSRRACYDKIRAYLEVTEQKEPKVRNFIGVKLLFS